MANAIITKIFTFDSAHKLNNYPGNCANLHGHTWTMHISVKGEVDSNGFVIDFRDLNKIVNDCVISKLDHKYLNDIISQPTAENICTWAWQQLKDKLIGLEEIKLYETANSYCVFRGS